MKSIESKEKPQPMTVFRCVICKRQITDAEPHWIRSDDVTGIVTRTCDKCHVKESHK